MRTLKQIAIFGLSLLATLVCAALAARRMMPRADDPSAGEIRLVSIFDGTDLRSTSSGFRGGTVWTIFGGTRLDLRRAEISDRAHLEMTTLFGGVELTVPDTWSVAIQGPTVAGAVDVSVPEPPDVGPLAPRFTVATRTLMGGVRIVARPVLKAADSL